MASKDDRKSSSSFRSLESSRSSGRSRSLLEADGDACGGREVTIAGQFYVPTQPDVKRAQHGPTHTSQPQPVLDFTFPIKPYRLFTFTYNGWLKYTEWSEKSARACFP